MKCRKQTKSGWECSNILLSGPKGLVCPRETSHQDAQVYEVLISTTVRLTHDRLNLLRVRLERIWPTKDWSNEVDVIRFIINEYISTGEFSDIVDEPSIMIDGPFA